MVYGICNTCNCIYCAIMIANTQRIIQFFFFSSSLFCEGRSVVDPAGDSIESSSRLLKASFPIASNLNLCQILFIRSVLSICKANKLRYILFNYYIIESIYYPNFLNFEIITFILWNENNIPSGFCKDANIFFYPMYQTPQSPQNPCRP